MNDLAEYISTTIKERIKEDKDFADSLLIMILKAHYSEE